MTEKAWIRFKTKKGKQIQFIGKDPIDLI